MNATPLLLIVIAIILIYVAYLKFRLSITPRPTYVIVPSFVPAQSAEERSGCATPLTVLLAIIAFVVIMVFGLPLGN